MRSFRRILWPVVDKAARPGRLGDAESAGWLVRVTPLLVSLGVHVLLGSLAGLTFIVVRATTGVEESQAVELSLGQGLAELAPDSSEVSPEPAELAAPVAPPVPVPPAQAAATPPSQLPPPSPVLNPTAAPAHAQPVSRFFGTGDTAHQVVFVIDCSGSMIPVFDEVRREVLVSISHLRQDQSFHVILFAGGNAYPNGPGKLVPPTREFKLQTADFLGEAMPLMSSDPLPAMEAAFAALMQAGTGQKLIYLLTDGVFPDNEKAIQTIRKLNPNKRVAINTYLYSDAEGAAADVMRRIALENRGQFKIIQPRE